METNNTQLVSSVVEPQSMAGELAQLKELTGGNPIVTVVLVAVVILGSGAGWKFWQKKSEQKHELEMKKLEMQVKEKKARSKAKAEEIRKKVKGVKKAKE